MSNFSADSLFEIGTKEFALGLLIFSLLLNCRRLFLYNHLPSSSYSPDCLTKGMVKKCKCDNITTDYTALPQRCNRKQDLENRLPDHLLSKNSKQWAYNRRIIDLKIG